jgi:hypothetical protein
MFLLPNSGKKEPSTGSLVRIRPGEPFFQRGYCLKVQGAAWGQ